VREYFLSFVDKSDKYEVQFKI